MQTQIESRNPLHIHISRVLQTAQASLKLLEFLEVERFTVIGIEIVDRRNPLIHIASGPRCAWLKKKHKAYTVGSRGGPMGRETIWRCDLMQCRVQWIERGN